MKFVAPALAASLVCLLALTGGAWARPVPAAASLRGEYEPGDGAPRESAAELAEYLADCATRLAPGDSGLARVALACPGIDYHVLHGPLAGAIDSRWWARYVDAKTVRALADAARTYDDHPGVPRPDAHLLGPLLERAQLSQQDSRSALRRLIDRLSAWFEGNPDRPDRDGWLARLLTKLGASLPSAHAISRIVSWAMVAVAVVLVIYGVRRARLWDRAMRRLASRPVREPQPPDAPAASPAGDLAARVSARFAARVRELEAAGILRGARALSCAEIAYRSAGIPGLEPLARAAPVVERLAYAPRRPPDAQLAAIDAELAGLGVPG